MNSGSKYFSLFHLMEKIICGLIFLSFLLQSSHGNESDLKNGVSTVRFDPSRVTKISWSPRAFWYKRFLTYKECDHLINLAKDKMERSKIIDDDTGNDVLSEVRTSSGMFLKKAQDEIVRDIEERISTWTFLPPENSEPLQILHYEHGQKYEPQLDVLEEEVFGGPRVVTVLLYLSDVEEGGETVFPDSEAKFRQPKGDEWSDCAKKGYAVKPYKGDALLFFSLHPNATTDAASLHGGCPVIKGNKWSATKWFHVRSFEKPSRHGKDGCVDEKEDCAEWAAAGECEKIPNFMIGSKEFAGYCRKSCKVCSS